MVFAIGILLFYGKCSYFSLNDTRDILSFISRTLNIGSSIARATCYVRQYVPVPAPVLTFEIADRLSTN